MGKHIIYDDDLYRIELGDGEWIDILERCTRAIKRKALAATFQTKGKAVRRNEDASLDIDYDAGAFNEVMLHEMIRAWSFKDKKNNPLPVTPENIDHLDDATAELVIETINRLNPQRGEEEKNAL